MCEEGKERKGKCYGFLGNSLGVNVSSMKNSTAAGLATVCPVLDVLLRPAKRAVERFSSFVLVNVCTRHAAHPIDGRSSVRDPFA